MVINFMKYEHENDLRQALEEYLKIGSATVEDVILFCNKHKLLTSTPIRIKPNDPERMQKHEIVIFCSTRAPSGLRSFFRLSNWKNILKKFFQLWMVFFTIVEWNMEFYFDNNILSEINVSLVITSF